MQPKCEKEMALLSVTRLRRDRVPAVPGLFFAAFDLAQAAGPRPGSAGWAA
jgi:hypothetical protein